MKADTQAGRPITGAHVIIEGDVCEVLRDFDANTFDACFCDPPYGLSDANRGKRLADSIYSILVKIGFPNLYQWDLKSAEKSGLPSVSIGSSDLSRTNRTIGIEPRIGMPERAVNLQGNTFAQKEVHNSTIPASDRISNEGLSTKDDFSARQFLGDFLLDLGDLSTTAASDPSGRSMPEAFAGGFAVPIFTSLAPSDPSFLSARLPIVLSYDVGINNDPLCQTKRPASVVALSRAVNSLMLRFDLRGTPLELRATRRACELDTVSLFACPKLVRANAAASLLSAVAEPSRVNVVGVLADGTDSQYWFHLWTPPHKRTVKILPQGGFMGKSWDASLPDPEVWREVYRVLKPGAFVLSFGGTRVYHRLASSIEDAGFEIRDSLAFAWVHGQGFPKSLDLGKSAGENWKGYGTALKPSMEPLVLAMKPADGTFAQNALTWGVAGLNIDESRIQTGESTRRVNRAANSYMSQDIGSAQAGRWPSNLLLSHHEDCREVGTRRVRANPSIRYAGDSTDEIYGKYAKRSNVQPPSDADGMEEVTAWECHPECPVGMLDEQGGVLQKRGNVNPSKGGVSLVKCVPDGGSSGPEYNYDKGGGASRFFYAAKVSTRERNMGGVDCRHATLKPMALTEYLSRLLLPPVRSDGSLRQLLIPFSGAGSEVAGALRAGWDLVIGIENDAESVQWAEARIAAAVRETETGIREAGKRRHKAAIEADEQLADGNAGAKDIASE